jgi:RNA polymerase sigma-70 factor (sigma-E family)
MKQESVAAGTEPPPQARRAMAAAGTAAGDGFDTLYRSHALGLVRLALVLVGDRTTAEDVVQDSFLGLLRGRSRLRDPDRALSYLRASVVNGCRSVQRARRTAWLRAERHHPQEPPVWSAEAAAIAGEEQREVLAAVARLPRRQREVLALRYFAGLGDSEIASVLRVSRGTVSSTASRGLAALARQLRSEHGMEDQ